MVSKHNIIGLFWFEDENEALFIVTKEWYIKVLQQNWTALGRPNCGTGLNMFERDRRQDKEDEATSHAANRPWCGSISNSSKIDQSTPFSVYTRFFDSFS